MAPTDTDEPRPFLPARDFAVSRAFYQRLGFETLLDGEVAIFRAGRGSFILQRYYQKEWAENCMMQLMVDDLDAWWAHLEALDLPSTFDVQPPKPPALQPWGLRVAYLYDPAGVLWHIAQRRPGAIQD
ncbi:VOC family protein [Brevundimonas sp.]|uniref:VOC family protein n=1 Tax=Brevundimonas sp. TaxID=1871086 RepID=UPI002D43DDB3|nr:VOC family protein [Brevundimonas sp.]HYC68239.1 VOC family protein [Brevundimonas sp.]